jgi:hypothetical protein
MMSSIQIALLFLLVSVRDRCRPRYGAATEVATGSNILGNAAKGRKEEAWLAGA